MVVRLVTDEDTGVTWTDTEDAGPGYITAVDTTLTLTSPRKRTLGRGCNRCKILCRCRQQSSELISYGTILLDVMDELGGILDRRATEVAIYCPANPNAVVHSSYWTLLHKQLEGIAGTICQLHATQPRE